MRFDIHQIRQDWFNKAYSACLNPYSINPDDFVRVYSDDGDIHFRNSGNGEAIDKASKRPSLEWVASILVSNKLKSCKKEFVEIGIKKCGCNSVWCPSCFKKKRAGELAEKMRSMEWERVRLITLTIDRFLYDGPQEAYEEIKKKKMLAQFIHNLSRTAGINVTNWMWFLEWSSDGFPHYHFVIEVAEKGRAGMIGQENIHHYWPLGRIHEEFVTNERHWVNLAGYFGKHGYFGDKKQGKAKQGLLPEWALKYQKSIRRSGSMRQKTESNTDQKGGEFMGQAVVKQNTKKRVVICPPRKPYEMILNKCGSRVIVDFYFDNCGFGNVKIDINYNDLLKEYPGGIFQPGIGYCVDIDLKDFQDFCQKYREKSEEITSSEAFLKFIQKY